MQWCASPLRSYRSKLKEYQEKCMWTWAFGGTAARYPEPENGKTGKRENGKVSWQHTWAYPGDAPDVHLKVTAMCTQDTLTVHLQVPFWYFLGTP